MTLDIALSAMHCHWEIAQRETDSQLDIVIPDSLAVGSAMLHVSTYDPGVDHVQVGHMLVNERKRTIGRGSLLPLPGASELIVNSVAYATRQRSEDRLGGAYKGKIVVPESLDPIARVTYM